MTNMTITAVLFDWDFTLARTLGDDVSFSQRTAILFQQNGIVCTQADIEAALNELHEDIRQNKAPGVIHPQKKRGTRRHEP